MHWIDADTLHECKHKLSTQEKAAVQSQLVAALTLLHDNGIVFGDMRANNVLVLRGATGKRREAGQESSEVKIMLCDFDWSAHEGEEYPYFMNQDICWPEGVSDGSPMLRTHDLIMLEKIWNEGFI